MKIAILGYSGCGKSTLAGYLGKRFGIPVLHLDRVHFQADWAERNREEALGIVQAFMRQDNWVIDGNYTQLMQNERLEQADAIVYFCFPRHVCLYRVLKRYRTFRHQSRDSMADGCIEKLDWDFIWWILVKGRNRRKRAFYGQMLKTYERKAVVFKNQKDLDAFWKAPFADRIEKKANPNV